MQGQWQCSGQYCIVMDLGNCTHMLANYVATDWIRHVCTFEYNTEFLCAWIFIYIICCYWFNQYTVATSNNDNINFSE